MLGLFYIHLEPYFIQIKKLKIKISGLKKPIKVIFFADLQARKSKGRSFLRRVSLKILNTKPDLVLLGGDLISNEYSSSPNELAVLNELSILTDKLIVYAVLGNHEYGRDYDEKADQPREVFIDQHDRVAEVLKKMNIKLLQNTLTTLSLNGQEFALYGTDDLWGGRASWENIKSTKKETPLLVLTHNPDTIMSYPENIKLPNLVLAGHTHGGQIRLPFYGPVGNARLKLGRKFYQGLLTWGKVPLFVTHGLGESMFAMRFLAPPEIVEITLLPE